MEHHANHSEMRWTQEQAISLCVAIEAIAPKFGYHVALTGGCLYKAGERKDLDLIFYKNRTSVHGSWLRIGGDTARAGLIQKLCDDLNFRIVSNWGPWKKIVMQGERSIDMLFPDEEK